MSMVRSVRSAERTAAGRWSKLVPVIASACRIGTTDARANRYPFHSSVSGWNCDQANQNA